MRQRALAIELGLLALVVALAWLVGASATDAWITRVRELGVTAPAADDVRSSARQACLWFSLGVVGLGAARVVGARRARDPLPVHGLLPALAALCLCGLVFQLATVDVVRGAVRAPGAIGFAQGFVMGAAASAAVLLAPIDVERVASRAQLASAATIALIFLALAVAGSGPGESGTRINLGPVQPIEAVKLLAVVFLAAFLGRRAAKLRWHRRRVLGLRWPRFELMAPALAGLVTIVGALFVVNDLGPVLVLACVFLGMFYVVTRASGWVAAATGFLVVVLAAIHTWPGIVDTGRVATRVQIWKDPWGNGLSHGHQVGEGLWAIAAGGATGQGLAQANVPLPPAGKTDLALAPFMEQLGWLALVVYLGLLGTVVAYGFRIAAQGRTPVRVLLATGAAILLLVQWAVIHAGTFGLLPLTGIVVPFLSTGRSSMVAFLVLAALLVRLATDGRARESTSELAELQDASRRCGAFAIALLVVGALTALLPSVVSSHTIGARGIRVTLADGTRITRSNPRLAAIATQIRRGTIEDRNGEPLASSPSAGAPRSYPLGRAMGTLLGPEPSRILRPPWALERIHDRRLRGADLTAYAGVLELPRSERAARIRQIDEDVASRSVRISVDARLQREVATILADAVKGRRPAAAAVVVDVDTGQVLARAQAPDLDPADASWQDVLLASGAARRRLVGAYGPWPDRTGTQGMFQAGSIAKLFTAVAAARAGLTIDGAGCRARAAPRFECRDRDADGPLFTQRGWHKPIHDHHDDPTHGTVDLVGALAVSCNVYFAQLGLAIGAEPLVALRKAGVDIGYTGASFEPGAAGSRQLASSAFGQGAMVMSPMQAARLVAAIAAGGTYRRCPSTMELSARCTETRIVDDPHALAPIVAGMRQVMTDGTGKHLGEPPGLRIYGKTGTADASGFLGEEPFGFAPGAAAPPHSWFVAFGEPSAAPECGLDVHGRIAVAVVVPRGGSGASAAGPVAMKIFAAARDLGYLGAQP
ncbi:MAG TPA: FtsW/RodA/SpoVE family cell cycle protein [Kofleriaceae bacterium]|nr:FtsW/RodA/SpoVE family cell cycle protein [Kofleriaceae bacterium]